MAFLAFHPAHVDLAERLARAVFLPIGIWLFYGANGDGVLSVMTAIGAFALGAGLMAYPIVLLKLRDKPFFKQG